MTTAFFFTHGHELLRPLRGNYFNYRNQNSLIVNVQCEHFTKEIIQYMQCKTYTEIFKAVLRSQELEQPRCSSVVE